MINIAKPYIGEEEKEAVIEVLESGMLAQGQKVEEFEKKFAKTCGTKFAVAVNSGTAALHSALHAVGIEEGDEVITVPFTFVATANSILMQGATPVFVDIKEDTFNIDPEKVEEAVTDKTKAIITVDLFGQAHEHDEIRKIAEKHGLKIVDDACQAVGGKYKDKRVGSLGDVSTFSLYATKNIMTGEGGMITTDNKEIADSVRRFRHHGQSKKYEYEELGYNYRMMDLQAALGLCQLNRLDEFTRKRRKNAETLTSELKGVKGIRVPKVKESVKHVFHQYTARITENFPVSRDVLKKILVKKDIGTGIFYPKPLHLHPNFEKFGYAEGDFPVSERISEEVLSLPVHPGVTKEELEKIIQVIKDV